MNAELLAPAGDADCARAAVENGADAVYFGLRDGFNARLRAVNFPLDELPGLLAMLHRQGVKGYVTLNTLVFTEELPAVEQTVRRVVEAGVDAILVQDLGLARLIRQICADVPLHASTQMTLSSGENIRAAEALGIARVVLPRELSLAEIAQLRTLTDVPLEAFVHGALCVSYSGQCLASEALGGRSANRGACAQACRLDYEMICDGQSLDLGARKYLLSPQDLAAHDLLPDLLAAGVSAFKIEGRLKSAEYVAHVTAHYRQALDAALAGTPIAFSAQQVEELEMSFSRGFSHGFLAGPDHKALVPATASAKQGVLLGTIRGVRRERVLVELSGAVKRGDGVAFEGDRRENADQGGRVYEVFQNNRSLTEPIAAGVVELSFAHGAIDWSRVHTGQRLWKTDDPQLARRLRKSFASPTVRRRVALDLSITAAVGAALVIEGQAENGARCRVASESVLAPAEKHPLTVETLRQQLGRLGNTVYTLRDVQAQINATPMIPLSVLGRLRREVIQQLDASLSDPPPRKLAAEAALARLRAAIVAVPAAAIEPQLHVLCRQPEQVPAVLATGVRSLMADFQDIRRYGDAVTQAHAAGAAIFLASPRIQKPGEMGILWAIVRHAPDGILARNLATLAFCRQERIAAVADFSLNAVNELTVDVLRGMAAGRVTAAYDLDRRQLLDLAHAAPADALEVVVHQQVPLFHTEHCVFCAVLSSGTNSTNCGRPCDQRAVRLRDHVGEEHRLTADVACRNTLYRAVAQSAAELIPELLTAGVRHFRVELLEQSGAAIGQLIDTYRRLLDGRITGREAWAQLRAVHPEGITRGTFDPRCTLPVVG